MISAIHQSISDQSKLVIFYANAYNIYLTEENEKLKKAMLIADLIFPDGTGIWIASWALMRKGFRHRFNFTDIAEEFLKICVEQKWKLYLLGSTDRTLQKAKQKVMLNYPELHISGFRNGFSDILRKDLIAEINCCKPDILMVGMGSPKQEIWIYENFKSLRCNIVISVGDVFSLYAGEKIRGPKIFQNMCLEWLIRLISNPFRYSKRYIAGIPRFLNLIIKSKLKEIT